MLQSILSNLAIILLMHLLMTILANKRGKIPEKVFNLGVIVLFSSAVITLFYLPIQFGEYRLDLRAIPLIFLALFRGWRYALPVLIIASIWRFMMGGDGAVPGIVFGMVGPTLLALLFYKRNKSQSNYVKKILIVTGAWIISDLPIVLIIPDGLEVFKQIFVYRYFSFLGSGLILYTFVLQEYKKQDLKLQLEYLATHDQLTGLPNKTHFFNLVEAKMEDSHVDHYIAMIDIDYFKQLNDTYGHLAGDRLLKLLGDVFKRYESDDLIFGRYGGEEFIAYLSSNDPAQVIEKLSELQKDIRSMHVDTGEGNRTSVTVSIGVAKFNNGSSHYNVIKEADDQLYIAKNRGRDQLVSIV